MEIDLSYKCNIDYEFDLFEISKRPKNLVREFEYLFLLCSNKPLLSNINYSADYLEHLKRIGFDIPLITTQSSRSRNWWGELSNIPLEQNLNSKITSYNISKKLNMIHPSSAIVSSNEELASHMGNHDYEDWILKDPYLFSGKGFKYFRKKEKPLIKNEVLVEAHLDRVCDIGTIVGKDNYSQHINFVDSLGGYKGSLSDENKEIISCEDKNKIELIIDEYLQLGAKSQFCIDSFYYIENKQEIFNPLVEVNYRKSMGYITHKLREFIQSKLGLFFIIPSKKLPYSLNAYEEIQEEIGDAMLLSPKNNYFCSFFVAGEDIKAIKSKIKCETLLNYLEKDLKLTQRLH